MSLAWCAAVPIGGQLASSSFLSSSHATFLSGTYFSNSNSSEIILNGFFRYQVIKWRQLRVGRYDFDHHGLSSCSLDSWWYSGVKEYYRSLLGRQHRRSRWRLKAVYTDISDNSKPHENQRPGHLKAFSSLERKSQMILGWFQRVEISTLAKFSIILKGSFDIYASFFVTFWWDSLTLIVHLLAIVSKLLDKLSAKPIWNWNEWVWCRWNWSLSFLLGHHLNCYGSSWMNIFIAN